MAVEEASAPLVPPAADPLLRPVAAAEGARKWLAIGTGVGIEIAGADLRVVVARVRPSGVDVVAYGVIQQFESRPAAEWGAEYAALAKRAQVGSLPVTVLLPRREVIVRHLNLPGVEAKELGSAVSWQVDSLHPYADQPMLHAWARLEDTANVMVGLVRQEVVDHFANLFTEAGLKLAGFSFSAAALHSASRILVTPPAAFLAVHSDGALLEAYGESAARPVFSTWFDDLPEGVEPRALAEMRADAELVTGRFFDLMPAPRREPGEGFEPEEMSLAFAAAIASACPRLTLDANLLPIERRSQSARWVYIPTIVLAALLAVAALLLAWQPGYQEREYLQRLAAEIRKVEPRAMQAAKLDAAAADAQRRIELLDAFRRRSQADAEALRELTNLIPPPGWVQSLSMTRTEVQLAGEAEQAAALIKVLDGSALFKDSAFSNSVTRSGASEGFAIRMQREGPGTGEAQ
ncbi:MAG: PilN domain-containing protein [Betaproteobacteria bacterium]|nr:PilN domain-containing protein [Betaproteobacteria bacterium]